MDAHTGAPLTPLYSRDPPPPPAIAASAENPSAAGVGAGAVAAAEARPTVGLARSLFLPPRMTTPTGGVAPAPSRAAAAPSERKKGKNIREEEDDGRLRQLEGEEEGCSAAAGRGVYRSAGELTR
ncbi:hypothetical protein D1007_56157 [Hordeum vulgare]|nr:hypothetical protein D1007_56157 [Hordeum vulgare]